MHVAAWAAVSVIVGAAAGCAGVEDAPEPDAGPSVVNHDAVPPLSADPSVEAAEREDGVPYFGFSKDEEEDLLLVSKLDEEVDWGDLVLAASTDVRYVVSGGTWQSLPAGEEAPIVPRGTMREGQQIRFCADGASAALEVDVRAWHPPSATLALAFTFTVVAAC